MLTKQAVICQCRLLDFPIGEYCVTLGAAMVMYGIIQETKSIELHVSPQLFESLTQRYPVKLGLFDEPYISFNERIDIFKREGLPESPFLVSNIPVVPLEDVLEAKKKMGRCKDLEDIELIEDFMNKQNKK